MKKKLKALKKNAKMFILFYMSSAVITILLIKLFDVYNYRNNIYYHDELRLSDDELDDLEKELSSEVGVTITRDDNALVLNAAVENENLTDEEKEIIYNYVDLLNDNPYLDKDAAYDNLRNLEIEYDEDADYGEDVMGVYMGGFDDKIEIIKDDSERGTISHELVHCIYGDKNFKKNPKFFNEGRTELLTNEYFSSNPFVETTSYLYEIHMVKILCEIVGEDKVLEAYSKEDIGIVERELTKKTQLSNPEELIESMSNISDAIQAGTKVSEEDVNNVQVLLSTYFENNVDEDSIEYEMYLYNSEMMQLALDKHPQVSYLYNEVSKGIYTKVYFSKKLKEKYPNPVHINYFSDEASAQEKSYKKTW